MERKGRGNDVQAMARARCSHVEDFPRSRLSILVPTMALDWVPAH